MINTNRGFIKWVIIIVVALLVLSYYGFSLRTLVDSPTTQDNFQYVATSSVSVWDKYLKQPATYLWKDVFINLIWTSAVDNLTRLKNGEPTVPEVNAPKLPNPVPMPN